MQFIIGIVIAGLFLLVTGFSTLNASEVLLNYYTGEVRAPLSLIVVSVFVIGIVIGFGFSSLIIFKQKMVINRLNKLVKKNLQELSVSEV